MFKLLSRADAKTIKAININQASALIKRMNIKSIIADNSDIVKANEAPRFFGTGCVDYDYASYDYEQLVIDLYELKKIQNKLK